MRAINQKNKLNMKTVRIFDFKTQTITTIPEAELAPGYIRAKVAGVGQVFVRATQDMVKRAKERPYRHPPFVGARRKACVRFSKIFRAVMPQTADEWEAGFRKDVHADNEMVIWTIIAREYERLVGNKPFSFQRKRDFFGLIMSAVNNGKEYALHCFQPNVLSRKDALALLEQLDLRILPPNNHFPA
jgi:hypothetical protein